MRVGGDGDGQAERDYFGQLERAARNVRRFVALRVTNHADAEDIAQQTLLVALAKRDTFRGGSFASWLFTIARHLIIDHYRAQKRFQFVQVEPRSPARVEAALQTRPDAVMSACESRDRLRCWLGCVSRHLQVNEQVAVLLADVYGYQDKNSAALLDISLPRFKLLLHGARVRLQRHAGGACALVGSATPNARKSAPAVSLPAGAADGSRLAARAGRRPTTPRLLALRAYLLEGMRGLSVVLVGLWLAGAAGHPVPQSRCSSHPPPACIRAIAATHARERSLSFHLAGSS